MKVAIIGGGASGVAMAIALQRLKVTSFTVFEKAGSIGGTWRDNIYPGLTCDIPSHLYRFSFSPNSDWAQEYASGGEICDYIRRVAREHSIESHIRFNTEITECRFADSTWTLRSNQGDEGVFDAVVTATGILHHPVKPAIPGDEEFEGESFHSSNWRAGLDLSGRRVGIIGTGSTAVQILPAIIDDVASCTLFQRTPQWIFPAKNNPIPEEKRALFRREPARMQALYELLGTRFNESFAASVVGENEEGLRSIAAACLENLEQNVSDPELRKRLTPDYAAGCKRLVVSDKFYQALQKPNAHLADSGIRRIERNGVRTNDGALHELDVLVFATGFDPFRYVRPMKVLGARGLSLDEAWRSSHKAYRTVAVPGFPNFFMLGGPNSPIGNFSFLMTVETQINYVIQLLAILKEGKVRALAPTEEATDRFNADVEKAMPKTVWVTGGCSSWFFDKHGHVVAWPWTFERFKNELSAPVLDHFDLS